VKYTLVKLSLDTDAMNILESISYTAKWAIFSEDPKSIILSG